MRQLEVRTAIQDLSGDDFELFTFELLRRELYPGLNPTSRTHDLGEDARTEKSTVFMHHDRFVSVFAAKTSSWTKLNADCSRSEQTGRQIDIAVFVTADSIRTDVQENWRTQVKENFGWHLECRSIDWIAPVACHPDHEDLVQDYLKIPPPGGDFLRNIEAHFDRETARAIPRKLPIVTGLPNPIERHEFNEIETLLLQGQSVFLTGGAGSGKSSIGYQLTRRFESTEKTVLFLDSRRLVGLQNLNDLRRHLDLNGPILEALTRLGAINGCLLIIDQLDTIAASSTLQMLHDLLFDSLDLEGVEAIVISRRTEAEGSGLLKNLVENGFHEIASEPLTEDQVMQILSLLEIKDASPELLELGSNLFNLDLIGRIKAMHQECNFLALTNEVVLWEQYRHAIIEQESTAFDRRRANEIIAEAVRLAQIALNRSDRSIILNYPLSLSQERLVSWEVLVRIHGRKYRFRHEQLHDYLYAWNSAEQDLTLDEFLDGIDPHSASGVLRWVDQIYAHQMPIKRIEILRQVLSPESKVPYHGQTSILDAYIHAIDPSANPDSLEVILNVLKMDANLRRHFFRSQPPPSWAEILWDHGFFSAPPSAIEIEPGVWGWGHWDVQRYLRDVAIHVPDIVVKHAQMIDGPGWYLGWSIDALCRIPVTYSVDVVPRIVTWMADHRSATDIARPVHTLMSRFIEEAYADPALELFESLTSPVPSQSVQHHRNHGIDWVVGFEAQSISNHHRILTEEIGPLCQLDAPHTVSILDRQLRLALKIEEESGSYADRRSSIWRSAIEDTDQDLNNDFKDRLLVGLRDSIKCWINEDPEEVINTIQHYLVDEIHIFKRLGLHFLQSYPSLFSSLARNELVSFQNLDDSQIMHEFFLLMRDGYPLLDRDDQRALVSEILNGPPLERMQRMAEFASNNRFEEKEYLSNFAKYWTRDRLWMLRKHLKGEPKDFLANLVKEMGKPKHPTFGSYSYGAERVRNNSPLDDDVISELSSEQLLKFISDWSEDEIKTFPERESLEALDAAMARVFTSDPEQFSEQLFRLSINRPSFASIVLNRYQNKNDFPSMPWDICIELSRQLLLDGEDEMVNNRNRSPEWHYVRLSIANLLKNGLRDKDNPVPINLNPIVRDILLALLEDNDPQEFFGKSLSDEEKQYDVPMAALNSIRPIALAALIEQALQIKRISHTSGDEFIRPSTTQFDQVTTEVLTCHLDKKMEKSLAVHSIFGMYLPSLYSLDKNWVECNIDKIFPVNQEPEAIKAFDAAWDAYVAYWHYCPDPELRHVITNKYIRAIENISQKSSAPQQESLPAFPLHGLAQHIAWDHLTSANGEDFFYDDSNLITKLLCSAPPEICGRAAWAVWRFTKTSPKEFWSNALSLWKWRSDVALESNNNPEFDFEISWYVHLLEVAPETENIDSLMELILCAVPHVSRSQEQEHGWKALETFIDQQIITSPLEYIRLYALMFKEAPSARWFHPDDNKRSILEKGAKDPKSRSAALDLIDSIARTGEDGYRDIYLKYC